KYGWIRGPRKEGFKSYKKVRDANPIPLPDSVSLLPQCPPVRNQGNAGDCVFFSTTETIEFLEIKSAVPYVELSKLFPYYGVRQAEGDPDEDGGAQIGDA